MLKTIDDRCPSASPGRFRYLMDRLTRELAEYTDRVDSSALDLEEVETPEGLRSVVRLTLRLQNDEELTCQSSRRRLPDALADVFDAAGVRLSDPRIPLSRRRGA